MKLIRNKIFISVIFLIGFYALHAQPAFEPLPDFFRTKRAIPLVELSTQKDIYVADYGAVINDGRDDIKGISEAIAAAKNLAKRNYPVRVIFEKGIYDLIPDEKSDARPLNFSGLEQMVIDGKGAELIMHNPEAGYMTFNNCNSLIVKNLILDYANLPFTQGVIVAKDEAAATFDLKIVEGFPLLSEPYFERAGQRWGMLKLPSGQLKEGVGNLFPYRGWTPIEGNVFRIKQPNSSYIEQMEIGDRFVQIARNNGQGAAIYTSNSQNITYLNLTIHASSAGSFNGNNMKEWAILNCTITPKSGRIHSCNADGVHVTGGYIGPWIQGCTFEGFSDDCINLKHAKREILSVLNSNEIIVKYDVHVGEELAFFNPREGILFAEVKVTGVNNLGNNEYQISLSEPVEITNISSHQTGDKCYITTRANESFVFRDNVVRNLRHAGLVIQAKYGVIEDCFFENLSNVGIHIKNIADWGEGFVSSDLLIKNNRFINCGFDEPYINESQSAAIVAEVMKLKMPCSENENWCGDEKAEWQGIKNITISNNYIEYNKKALNLANINGLTIEGCDYFHNPDDISLLPGEESLDIKIDNCSNINNRCKTTGVVVPDQDPQDCIIKQIGNELFLQYPGLLTYHPVANIYKYTGEQVYSSVLNSEQMQLSLSGLTRGVYILEVLGKHKRCTKKIVIN
jgi:hypothetical protein